MGAGNRPGEVGRLGAEPGVGDARTPAEASAARMGGRDRGSWPRVALGVGGNTRGPSYVAVVLVHESAPVIHAKEIVISSRNQRHVTRCPEGDWQVRAHASRASAVEPTQGAATDRARQILENDGGGELVIHRPDGRIRDSDTIPPANDAFPPRDRR